MDDERRVIVVKYFEIVCFIENCGNEECIE